MKLFQWQLWKLPGSISQHLYRRQVPAVPKIVAMDENPGKILRVNSMYWTDLLLAWLSSIVWKFVLRSSHSPGTRLKRLKLSVSILGGSYSHLCRYFKSSKKMDIAIWIFALTSRPFAVNSRMLPVLLTAAILPWE